MKEETAERQVRVAEVLTKAVLRAARILDLSQKELAAIIGVSPATLSRIAGGQKNLAPDTKEGELALLFVRVFRSLDALLGGDDENGRIWLRTQNLYLAGVPLDRMQSVKGLVDVADYLDAMRGKP